MPLLKIFDDKNGNGGGQMKSDDLRTMTTIGKRTLHMRIERLVGHWRFSKHCLTLETRLPMQNPAFCGVTSGAILFAYVI